MPPPLTISEVARRLGRHRSTVARRIDDMGMRFNVAMSEDQFLRLKNSFTLRPNLPRGGHRSGAQKRQA